MLNLLQEIQAARRRRLDHRMFHRRRPAWHQILLAVLIFVLVFLGSYVKIEGDHLVWDRPGERPLIVFVLIWTAYTMVFRRALAYRRGWLAGRRALRSSMYEATIYEMSPEEWMNAELDRDARTLGYPTFDQYLEGDDGT